MRAPASLPAEPPAIIPFPPWKRIYPGDPGQARHLRAALRPLLDGCPPADDVILIVSELAANAIAHSDSGQPSGTFTVRLHHDDGHIRAEVQDQGSSWDGDLFAAARPPHGLYLVATLAAACGTAAGPGRSRLVWARIHYPPHP
jgi:serine/threonine-protein kinase RsbW